ncbi:amidohydrolase [Paenibacillus sp. IB182496]|uniref:5-methylthioadenosine/S-adenosylhomocysteine deaminase n=1 Tax=Paenibacillus sabuli TaxID=2772509 RepID=A0A927BRT7_9BACL|nr:amidohydrolase [Paenibacillus sabuli]MBD2845122.1 amidohydrolase [Paenibacillus sabuli]
MRSETDILQGHMVVDNGRIVSLGAERPAAEAVEGAQRINGAGLLFMPGLINTHGHAAMALLRGYSDDQALQVWLERDMWPMEGKYTSNETRWGTALALAEMLRSGTTSFVDMYDRMDIVAEVTEGSGMRGWLARGAIGLCSEAEQDAKLREAVAFARDWDGKANGRIHTMLSPHAPYTCPPAFIERFVQASVDYGLPMHTHMSETVAEVARNVEDYGCRPVEHLDRLGLLARPSFVAHAVHLTDEEIALLAARGTGVSHNPASNLKLASGVAPVPRLLAAGIPVSLGTDSAASNNNLDLFDEIRLAALIHKGVSGDPTAVPAFTALQLGTTAGARTLWAGEELGMLEPGMKADFIALDIDQPHWVPRTDMVSHLVYAGSGRDVRHVWVDGAQVVKDGRCTQLDEERIMREAQLCFDKLNR